MFTLCQGTDEDVEGSSGGDGEEKSELKKVENEKTDDEVRLPPLIRDVPPPSSRSAILLHAAVPC